MYYNEYCQFIEELCVDGKIIGFNYSEVMLNYMDFNCICMNCFDKIIWFMFEMFEVLE